MSGDSTQEQAKVLPPGHGRVSACLAEDHDVEVFGATEAQAFIYRHGPFRFEFPVTFPNDNGALAMAYERTFDDWLKIVHGSLVPDRRR